MSKVCLVSLSTTLALLILSGEALAISCGYNIYRNNSCQHRADGRVEVTKNRNTMIIGADASDIGGTWTTANRRYYRKRQVGARDWEDLTITSFTNWDDGTLKTMKTSGKVWKSGCGFRRFSLDCR